MPMKFIVKYLKKERRNKMKANELKKLLDKEEIKSEVINTSQLYKITSLTYGNSKFVTPILTSLGYITYKDSIILDYMKKYGESIVISECLLLRKIEIYCTLDFEKLYKFIIR